MKQATLRLTCALASIGMLTALPAVSADATDDQRKPPVTKFSPTKLDKGKTRAGYVDGKTLHDGKKQLELDVPHDVWDAHPLRNGYLVETDDPKTGWGVIHYRVENNGKVTKLRRFPKGLWSLHINSDGKRVVAEIETPSRSRLTVYNAYTNKVIRSKKIGQRVDVLNYVNGRVLLTRGVDKSTLSWYRPKANKQRKIATVPGWARFADPGMDVIGLGAGEGGSCYDVRRFKAPGEKLWRLCPDKGIQDGVWFSPNGDYALTKESIHDKPKFETVFLRRVSDGSVVRTFKARRFGTLGWENNKSILVEAAAEKQAARVRCTVAGTCTRVSRLVKGRDNFYALDNLDTLLLEQNLLS